MLTPYEMDVIDGSEFNAPGELLLFLFYYPAQTSPEIYEHLKGL